MHVLTDSRIYECLDLETLWRRHSFHLQEGFGGPEGITTHLLYYKLNRERTIRRVAGPLMS